MLLVVSLGLLSGGCTSGGSRGGIALNPAGAGSGGQQGTGDSRTTGEWGAGTPPGGGELDDPEPELIDPFELEEWNVVSFTDPRDQSVYDVIDGRVLIAFKNPPVLPEVDPNYFDVEIPPNDPFYSEPYPLLVGDPEVDAFIAAEDLEVYSEWLAIGAIAAVLPEGQSVADAVANWPSEYPDLIECVDPDVFVGACTDPHIPPNDDKWIAQWAINEYANPPTYSPYSIRMLQAWGLGSESFGDSAFVTAILDTGVDYHVPDLQPNSTEKGCWVGDKVRTATVWALRTNGGGEPSSFDEDRSAANAEFVGHGTCVAGIISAAIDNDPLPYDEDDGDDTAGIACHPRYFPVAMKARGGFSTSTVCSGLTAIGCVKRIYSPEFCYGPNVSVPYYRIEVLNCSFGTYKSTSLYVKLITELSGFMLIVAGAGNDGSATRTLYPARDPRVMSIAAYRSDGQRYQILGGESSNYAPDTDICAPGMSIVTADLYGINGHSSHGYTLGYAEGRLYLFFGATSAAAAHVSAVAILVTSKHPSWWPMHVWQAITGSELYDLPSYELHYYGRLHAPRALLYTN